MPFTRRPFGCFGAWPRAPPPEQNPPRTSDLRKTQDAGSLFFRERASVRGNETPPIKMAGRILQAQRERLPVSELAPHRAKSLSMLEGPGVASAVVFRAFLPPHPALSLGERENRPPLHGESKALGRAAVSTLNRGAHG